MSDAEPLEVTQADRDAAAALVRGTLTGFGFVPLERIDQRDREIINGECDTRAEVQAFARHRIEALTTHNAELEAERDAAVEAEPVTFGYVNYRGQSSVRNAIPRGLRWGSTEWHKEPGWLLRAWDIDKKAEREFALADIDVFDDHPFALTAIQGEQSNG